MRCAASGCTPHVVERAPRLMSQQLDEAGGALLSRMVAELGIAVHVDVGTDVDRAEAATTEALRVAAQRRHR